MKISFYKEFVLLLITFLPLFILFIFWDQLPDEVATHYNLSGEADDWTEKSKLPYMLGGFGVFLYVTLLVVPYIDPKKKFDLMGNKYFYIRVITLLLLSSILSMMVIGPVSDTLNPTDYLPQIIFLFFAVLGNYLQSVKPNYFVGIRTPWTLESEEIWNKTHRLGGRVFMFGGVVLFLLSPILDANRIHLLLLGGVLVLALIPTIYSYILFRKQDN